MGARILGWLKQRRKYRRFVLLGIAVDGLIVRNGRTTKQPGPSPSGTGGSRKYGPSWQHWCQGDS